MCFLGRLFLYGSTYKADKSSMGNLLVKDEIQLKKFSI